MKHKIEIVSYGNRPVPIQKKRLVATVFAIFLVLTAFSIGTYLLLGLLEKMGETDTTAIELRATIDQGWELRVWEREEFVLSASNSTGDIVRYNWNIEGTMLYGMNISYRFNNAGQYTVRLEVSDSEGKNSRAQILVRTNHREEGIIGSTSSPTDLKYSKTFDVHGDEDGFNTLASRIVVNVAYLAGSTPSNQLNLTVNDGNNSVVRDGVYETSSSSGEKVINWTLSGHQWLALYTPGKWTITISQEAPLAQPRTVEFRIDIYVMY